MPLIPYAEGKVPGTGLSIAVSEYMQGVSNPQMPMEACADCGHTTCPKGCPCSNPDCPGKVQEQEACPGCGHTTCPPDCPCKAVDCPGRANARMSGVAHEVTEDEKDMARKMKAKGHKYIIILPKGKGEPLYTKSFNAAKEMAKEYGKGTRAMDIDKYLGEVTEGTVVEIDGDKITVWKDKDNKSADEAKGTTASKYLQQKIDFGGEMMPLGRAIKIMQKGGASQKLIDRWVQGYFLGKKIRGEAGPIRNAVTTVQKLLKGSGVEEATKELNSGLAKWLEMARAAKRVGNDKRAEAIMLAIEKVIADKDLDERTVYGWNETFNGALAPGYNRSEF